jgi:hypothetical protein
VDVVGSVDDGSCMTLNKNSCDTESNALHDIQKDFFLSINSSDITRSTRSISCAPEIPDTHLFVQVVEVAPHELSTDLE